MSRSWVYKLHFWPPYKHAAHYSGKTDRPPQRLADHALGRGARLTQVQLEAGGSWVVGLLEPGGADRERQIKGHDAARYCDVCKSLKGYQAGDLTAEQALGRAGWGRASEYDRHLLLEIFGIDRAEVDAEKVPYIPPKPIVPQPRPELIEVTPEIDALVDALIETWSPKARNRKPRPPWSLNLRPACDFRIVPFVLNTRPAASPWKACCGPGPSPQCLRRPC